MSEQELRQVEQRFSKVTQLVNTPYPIAQTPRQLVWTLNKAKLYRYAPRLPPAQRKPVPLLLFYALMSRPLLGMTRSLAVDWAKHRIRVNAIAPGYVATDFTERVRALDQYYQAILDHTPLGRFAEPHEIASAAIFLASDAASYVTGHVLTVDGGWLAT